MKHSYLSAGLFFLFLSVVAAPAALAQCGDKAAEEHAGHDMPSAEPDALVHEPFTPERFAELQEAGEFVLVDVFATWCPVCAEQQRVLAEFKEKHPFARLHMLQVDFDDQKEWVTHFKAPRQSTLILFKGDEQVWFSVAQTSREKIFAELNAALSAAPADDGKQEDQDDHR